MKNLKKLFLLIAVSLILLSGCTTTEVPPGYIGMVMGPEGLSGEVLSPGRHACWNRDVMILLEGKEETVTERMSILCKDDLNFKFDLKIRARLRNISGGKSFAELLKKKGSDLKPLEVDGGTARVLSFSTMYETYIKPIARSEARAAVSKLQTTQIRENRASIERTILEKLQKATEGTPMEVVVVTSSNFDYPDVITQAVEKKRRKEIEIEEEKATQAMELLKAQNRIKLAEKMKLARAKEAQAEAGYVSIMGKALTERYLKLKELEVKLKLYERVGAGDKVIIDGAQKGVIPMVNSK